MHKKIFSWRWAMMVIALAMTAATAHAAGPAEGGTVNINTATVGELMKLPGIGKAKAEAIVQYRTAQKFQTAEDLREVKGIGDKLFDQLRTYVRTDGATTLHTKPSSKKATPISLLMPTTGGRV